MKYFIIVFLLSFSLFAENIELNLKQFAELVSSQHKVNIIINNSLKSDNFTFFLQRDKNVIFLSVFKKMLELKGMVLIYDKKNNFYYIDSFKKPVLKAHYYNLDSPVFNDIKSTLNLLNVRFSYISNSNSLTYLCTDKVHKDIKRLIFNNDNPVEQFSLKISIIETNLNNVKERGLNFDSYLQSLNGSNQFFLKMLSMPLSSSSNVFDSSTLGFTAIMRYLNENSISKILSSPYFTVQSNKKISFSSVENIPYKVSSGQVNGTSQTSIENTEYRDVGLKIILLPKIVHDIIYIDLDLVVENILDKGSSTPSTSKRSLVNSFQLKKGSILVLSGINQDEIQNYHYGIPLLENIPFLGQIFTLDTKQIINKNLTITIEVL